MQVLDSYHNETYPDGACGAIYSIEPPKENAAKAPTDLAELRHRVPRPQVRGRRKRSSRPR